MAMVTRRTFVKGLTVSAVLGPALRLGGAGAQEGEPVQIGSKDFPEQFILGEMYAQILENAEIAVERKINLGGTEVAHEALVNGDIDLYPEYTGTGLLVVLKLPIPTVGGDATPGASGTPVAETLDDAVFQVVSDAYKEQFDLVWLDQAPMNNNQAIAVKRSFSEEHGVTTLSQLVALASTVDLVISAPSDFEEREDGLVGIKQTYGDFEIEVLGVAPGVKYQALLDDEANVVLAFGTDGEIVQYDLVVLEDDQGLFPPYHVAPVVRQDALDANPQLAELLNQIAPLLTDDVMRGLNNRVSGDEKAEPEDVAREFLVENGLITE